MWVTVWWPFPGAPFSGVLVGGQTRSSGRPFLKEQIWAGSQEGMARVRRIFIGNQNCFWKEETGAPTASTVSLDETTEAGGYRLKLNKQEFLLSSIQDLFSLLHTLFREKKQWEVMRETVFIWHHCLSIIICNSVWSVTLGFFWEGKMGDTFDLDGWKGIVLASSLACSGMCAT